MPCNQKPVMIVMIYRLLVGNGDARRSWYSKSTANRGLLGLLSSQYKGVKKLQDVPIVNATIRAEG